MIENIQKGEEIKKTESLKNIPLKDDFDVLCLTSLVRDNSDSIEVLCVHKDTKEKATAVLILQGHPISELYMSSPQFNRPIRVSAHSPYNFFISSFTEHALQQKKNRISALDASFRSPFEIILTRILSQYQSITPDKSLEVHDCINMFTQFLLSALLQKTHSLVLAPYSRHLHAEGHDWSPIEKQHESLINSLHWTDNFSKSADNSSHTLNLMNFPQQELIRLSMVIPRFKKIILDPYQNKFKSLSFRYFVNKAETTCTHVSPHRFFGELDDVLQGNYRFTSFALQKITQKWSIANDDQWKASFHFG